MIHNLAAAQDYSAGQVYFIGVIALVAALASVSSGHRAKSNGRNGLSLLLRTCAGILIACGVILIVGQTAFG